MQTLQVISGLYLLTTLLAPRGGAKGKIMFSAFFCKAELIQCPVNGRKGSFD